MCHQYVRETREFLTESFARALDLHRRSVVRETFEFLTPDVRHSSWFLNPSLLEKLAKS